MNIVELNKNEIFAVSGGNFDYCKNIFVSAFISVGMYCLISGYAIASASYDGRTSKPLCSKEGCYKLGKLRLYLAVAAGTIHMLVNYVANAFATSEQINNQPDDEGGK